MYLSINLYYFLFFSTFSNFLHIFFYVKYTSLWLNGSLNLPCGLSLLHFYQLNNFFCAEPCSTFYLLQMSTTTKILTSVFFSCFLKPNMTFLFLTWKEGKVRYEERLDHFLKSWWLYCNHTVLIPVFLLSWNIAIQPNACHTGRVSVAMWHSPLEKRHKHLFEWKNGDGLFCG